MDDLSSQLSTVSHFAREAGQLIMKIYRSDFSVAYKGPSDPVTEADQIANNLIVEKLKNQFPQDNIVAEESPQPINSVANGESVVRRPTRWNQRIHQ